MNPDDYIEGTFNPLNPSNWDEKLSTFESEDLSECLEFAKENHDFEPLENAIFLQEIKVKKALEKLSFCIDLMKNSENAFMLNQLYELKRELL